MDENIDSLQTAQLFQPFTDYRGVIFPCKVMSLVLSWWESSKMQFSWYKELKITRGVNFYMQETDANGPAYHIFTPFLCVLKSYSFKKLDVQVGVMIIKWSGI